MRRRQKYYPSISLFIYLHSDVIRHDLYTQGQEQLRREKGEQREREGESVSETVEDKCKLMNGKSHIGRRGPSRCGGGECHVWLAD